MKIVIAVDSSEPAEKTFDWYVKNLHKDDNEVFVCHEAEQPDFPPMMFAGAMAFPTVEIDRLVEEHRKSVLALQALYKKKCKESNLQSCKVMIDVTASNNNPGEGIIKRADDVGAEMLVMGTRGLGALRRTILGSVSDYVVHHAKIPVLICH